MCYILKFETYDGYLIYRNIKILKTLVGFFVRTWVFLTYFSQEMGEKNPSFRKFTQIFLKTRRTHFAVIRSSHIYGRSKEHFIKKKYKIAFLISLAPWGSVRDRDLFRDYLVSFCIYFLPSIFSLKVLQKKAYFL